MQGNFKKVVIGSDHAAVAERVRLAAHLRDRGIEVTEVGPQPGESCQYSDVAETVALQVAGDESGTTGGILVCGNGVGMSISANKVRGARAAVCNELFTARYAKRDSHMNILCMGSRIIASRLMREITDVWLEQPYGEGRYAERLAIMLEMEDRHLRADT